MKDDTVIEVVMRKKLTVAQYRQITQWATKKGWSIQGYQEGVYSEPLSKKIK